MRSYSNGGEHATIIKELKLRDCPVCVTPAMSGIPFLERRIDEDKFNSFSFASRKVPEYMNYKLLRCPNCDVIFACESPDGSEISHAYHQAAYDSKLEAIQAAETYEQALRPFLASMTDRKKALDIGTGSGVFLQRMRANGFLEVTGVEPSRAAIDAADIDIRSSIREGIFSAVDFEPSSFSLITCFMTLEHVSNPAILVRDCFRLLKLGGIMAVVVHDWRAWNNRLLGRLTPIVDIEHLQLFSKSSIVELCRRCGFVDIDCQSFWNNYQIDYWNRLLPIPLFLKQCVQFVLHKTGIGRFRLPMNVGNLMVVAHKKEAVNELSKVTE
ncbi:MAG: Ubiquinone biosynthesis O-methyltransferase [Candidatus Omnitrophica bacterium ADurb.Bin292]|jgi:SAM-dependent methyltransferase|nr:MAG: Ubiquinone biosynthesis O-methyltransferase [Candidatus Omnitrophica bacterium ADurb.Bin292]